jgi:hypothetical protein
MTTDDTRPRQHAWISNAAFARIYGIAKVCMDCGLGLEKGERLTAAERVCPGKREPRHLNYPTPEDDAEVSRHPMEDNPR